MINIISNIIKMDPIKINNYLSTLDEKNKNYVEKIINNTVFITTSQMIDMVRNSLQKFHDIYQKYNLFVPDDKIGSEHYILLQLKNDLHPVKVLYGDCIVDNDYPILLLDDAVYSSHHMCGMIDEFTYNKNINNKFYIIVAVLSDLNTDVTTGFNATIIAYMTLNNLLPNKLFDDYNSSYFYKHFKCETDNILPLFFEHKIANEFGSYQFYHHLTSKPITRACIDCITKNDIEKFVKSY